MTKTIAAVLLAATLAGGLATSASAQPYGYHHHWRHWHHWHHWHRHWHRHYR